VEVRVKERNGDEAGREGREKKGGWVREGERGFREGEVGEILREAMKVKEEGGVGGREGEYSGGRRRKGGVGRQSGRREGKERRGKTGGRDKGVGGRRVERVSEEEGEGG